MREITREEIELARERIKLWPLEERRALTRMSEEEARTIMLATALLDIRPEEPEALPDPDADRIGRFSNPAVSGAPPTQRLAAVQAYPKTGTQRRKVLDALAGDDLTDEQIEARIQIGQRQTSTRRKELELDGWVEDSGETRMSKAEYEVVVWRLTAIGRSQYPVRKGGT